MGVNRCEPMVRVPPAWIVPEGRHVFGRFHVAPFGALCFFVFVTTGLHRFAPVATTCRPSGTKRADARGYGNIVWFLELGRR